MTVTFIKKDGKKIIYNHAYEVYEHKHCIIDNKGNYEEVAAFINVQYPDELDYGVEAEMEYNRDDLDSVVITFEG